MSTKIKAFIGRTGGIAIKAQVVLEPVIYVAIDVAKYYHKAIIFDLNRKILEQPFGFDLSKDGFEKLIERIEFHAREQNAKEVAIGLEATGHYYENLAEHLRAKGYKVFLFNPYSTFKVRNLRLDYVKTDEIDTKAIGEAMLLGEGNKIIDEPAVYRQLRLLTRFRRAKNRARQALKNQMLRDLDRIWPGLMKDAKTHRSGLFTNLWNSKIARQIMKLNLLPQEIARLTPKDFLAICKSQGFKNIGIYWVSKIIGHAEKVLPCETAECFIHQQVMQTNLKLLEDLDKVIDELERQVGVLIHATPAIRLLSIEGVSSVTAAEFIAEIGNPQKYKYPGQWVKLAGLNASRYQTGITDRKNTPITKVGNRLFRDTVFTIARNISRWEPFFIAYKDKFLAKGKHIQKVYGAVGNKFIRNAFYMMLRNENFDPEYESKREKNQIRSTI